MKKRVLSMMLTATVCMGILAGCGGGIATSSTTSTDAKEENVTTEEQTASAATIRSVSIFFSCN